ncbi:MAG: hypothetical protein ACI85I_002857 [Arenicella sp.]
MKVQSFSILILKHTLRFKQDKMSKLIFSICILLFSFSSDFLFAQKLPKANQKVVEYVKKVMGTQVGLGECSDLIMNVVYYAGDANKSNLLSKFRKKKIFPGDIISFREARIQTENGAVYMPEHYAIIWEVKSKGVYVITHQSHNGVRTLQTLLIDLSKPYEGKVIIQRP